MLANRHHHGHNDLLCIGGKQTDDNKLSKVLILSAKNDFHFAGAGLVACGETKQKFSGLDPILLCDTFNYTDIFAFTGPSKQGISVTCNDESCNNAHRFHECSRSPSPSPSVWRL